MKKSQLSDVGTENAHEETTSRQLDINIERTEKPPDEVIRRAAAVLSQSRLFQYYGVKPFFEFFAPLGLVDVVVTPSESVTA